MLNSLALRAALLGSLLTAPSCLRAGPPPKGLPEDIALDDQLKERAPEDVDIEVARVSLKERRTKDRRDISVVADATLSWVHHSKSGLKTGDKIRLRYQTFIPSHPGAIGPNPILLVKPGRPYHAWLAKRGSYFVPAARAESIEINRPNGAKDEGKAASVEAAFSACL